MMASQQSHATDFTIASYRSILRRARDSYRFAGYRNIPYGTRFVLWRHDLDMSINRALRLAIIEHEEGVKATYFVNLHSDYYNPLETDQSKMVMEIASLGHEIGIHFDPRYYEVLHGSSGNEELDQHVAMEAQICEYFFGCRMTAVSFHNPSRFIADLGDEVIGGLVNCYSDRIRSNVSYVSDSNGYWRFRRLPSVVDAAKESCLQVLTHPVWWQESPVQPWERIIRSVNGRRQATLNAYEAALERDCRLNVGKPADSFPPGE
ncbi:MAG: hypothetical protein CME13_14400 [Gemmatimonadetes bacterium]|nr:hypothetical protein [Gemmatimonadota bacterium]